MCDPDNPGFNEEDAEKFSQVFTSFTDIQFALSHGDITGISLPCPSLLS